MPIFPPRPEDFAALSRADLEAFIADSVAAMRGVRDDLASFVTDERSATDVIEEARAGVAALDEAREALRVVVEAETAAAETELAALAEQAEPDEAEPEENDEPDETEPETASVEEPEAAEPVAEPITAAAPAPPVRKRPAQSESSRTPVADEPRRMVLTAAAPNLGHEIGDDVSLAQIAAMGMQKHRQFSGTRSGDGSEKIVLARADWRHIYGPERTLTASAEHSTAVLREEHGRDQVRMRETFLRQRETKSLVATGGLCAPVQPYYDLRVDATADRPVRAALAPFNADRGGIRFAPPASIGSITTGTARKTVTSDAAGGTSAAKACQRIDCPPFTEVDIAIIHHCLTIGNITSRTFPELVEQWNELIMAAQARIAESALLDGISAASKQMSVADISGTLGVSASLSGQILAASAQMRSSHRMSRDSVLEVLLPAWILDAIVADITRSQFNRFDDANPETFVNVLRGSNIEPTFYLDGETGRNQVYSVATSGGSLAGWPTPARWYLFPAGSFIFVDGGTLELGLVRDSTLNAANDFQLFGESFENVAFLGVDSYAVSSGICPSGTVSLPKAVTCPFV